MKIEYFQRVHESAKIMTLTSITITLTSVTHYHSHCMWYDQNITLKVEKSFRISKFKSTSYKISRAKVNQRLSNFPSNQTCVKYRCQTLLNSKNTVELAVLNMAVNFSTVFTVHTNMQCIVLGTYKTSTALLYLDTEAGCIVKLYISSQSFNYLPKSFKTD